jgi:hypothetical protein
MVNLNLQCEIGRQMTSSPVAARPIDRARHVGRDLTLARTKGARVRGGDVDHHGDRPLLACRLLLAPIRSGGTTSSPRRAMIGTSSGRRPEPAKPPPW